MYSPIVAFFGVVITGAIVYLNFYKIRGIYYNRIEAQFLTNLNQREAAKSNFEGDQHIAPWDSHLATFEIKAGMSFIGKTLQEIKFRERFGVNVAIIKRDDLTINIPARTERLYPKDVLSVIGTDDQLEEFRTYLNQEEESIVRPEKETEITLHQLMLDQEYCSLVGQSINTSAIREKTHGLVVGVERDNQRILNPESDFVFEPNDIVWIVGNEKRIQVYFNQVLNRK
jgi:CPA2 family monovalent cation:H+ antiporter-2